MFPQPPLRPHPYAMHPYAMRPYVPARIETASPMPLRPAYIDNGLMHVVPPAAFQPCNLPLDQTPTPRLVVLMTTPTTNPNVQARAVEILWNRGVRILPRAQWMRGQEQSQDWMGDQSLTYGDIEGDVDGDDLGGHIDWARDQANTAMNWVRNLSTPAKVVLGVVVAAGGYHMLKGKKKR